MPTAPSSKEAENFGPYEVHERLGMGGMAMVHRAKKRGPEGFEQNVALKRMLAHLAEDPTFVESFVREAKVASLLVHPNIAQVYDFGRIRGIYYIAMELVAGFDVRKLLRYASRSNEAIPLSVVLSILGELCDALDHAHNFVDDQGNRLDIVHRDISPSNLIVATTGHLKVIDFGIAKASSRQLHTESGKVKGKLGYMSPEAALGLNSGPVSDMFSTGVVAWELITASPLFTTRTDMETMQRIREGTIAPPSYHNPTCPPELDSLILAALEREPRARLSSAASFRAGLDDIAQRHGIATSARSVVEWIGRFAQPEDGWPRVSERVKPPSHAPIRNSPANAMDPTAQLRISSRRPTSDPMSRPDPRPRTPSRPPQLRRSAEHVALATEIWGEDNSLAPAPGPDFSIQDVRSGPQQMPGQNVGSTRVLGPTPPPSDPRHSTPGHGLAPDMRASGAATHGSVISLPQAQSARMTGLPLRASRTSVPPPGSYDSRQHSQPLPAMLPNSAQHSQPLISPYPVATTPPPETRRSKLPFVILGALFVVAGVLIAILIGRGDDGAKLVVADKPPPTAEPILADPPKTAVQPPTEPTPSPDAPAPDKVTPDTPVLDAQEPAVAPDSGTRKPTRPPNRKPPRVGARDNDPIEKPPEKPPEKPAITEKPPEKPPEKPLITEKPPEKPPEKPLLPDKPAKPARTPVVAASAVSKLSGETPTLRGNAGDADAVMVKVCLDESGRVSGVTAKTSPEILAELQRGLGSWRYKPFLRDGKASPVCFPLTFKLIKR